MVGNKGAMGEKTRNHGLRRSTNDDAADDLTERWNETVETIDRLLTVRDDEENLS